MDTSKVLDAFANIAKLSAMAEQAVYDADSTTCRSLLDSIELYAKRIRTELDGLNEMPR